MGDDYVVIKLWEKVFLEKKFQCLNLVIVNYFQEKGQIRMTQ